MLVQTNNLASTAATSKLEKNLLFSKLDIVCLESRRRQVAGKRKLQTAIKICISINNNNNNRNKMMHFMLLFSRQGKLRLQKWFIAEQEKQKKQITRDLIAQVLARRPKSSAFLEWKELKIVYRRYASLYFLAAIEPDDNQLMTLETIHRYVEVLDNYFGSVCELDIIFNFEKAYFILDELVLGGEVQESSRKTISRVVATQDELQNETTQVGFFEDYGLG